LTNEENLKKIIMKILDDSKAEADVIMSGAQKQAKQIEDEARQKAKGIEEDIIKDAGRKAEQEKRRIVADGVIKAKKARLEAREEVIMKAFEKAEEELDKIQEKPEYASILEGLVKQACIEIGGGDLEVSVREEDVSIIDDISKIARDVENETKVKTDISLVGADIGSPGTVVKTRDGRVEVVNTFATRLERMRPALRSEIARILF
jgi:V/A-type H+/Na+-transporting ATPase subunit E